MHVRPVVARSLLTLAAVLGIGVATPSSVAGQPVVTTLPAWDGSTSASLLSRDFFPSSVGQTFVTPDDAVALNGFTLFLGNDFLSALDGVNLQFHAYLFGWNGTTLSDLLWKSPLESGATELDLGARAFDVGGVSLTAGNEYAVVLSTLEADPFDASGVLGSPLAAYQSIGLIDDDAYSGGRLIQSVESDLASLQGDLAWLSEPDVDLAIELRFTGRTTGVPVPEPASLPLLTPFLVALLTLAVVRRTRRLTTR